MYDNVFHGNTRFVYINEYNQLYTNSGKPGSGFWHINPTIVKGGNACSEAKHWFLVYKPG